eukprot:TRINITY_DN6057_c0_g3_i4.p1 TRINITY_DN6057_c0_g3~~TRINITY_DN6057_c0_g3_i4.p1  ORF type:complete len:645 (+),score=191.29 TRINITY_DN6057_c0_g3_i4:45-1979(+)
MAALPYSLLVYVDNAVTPVKMDISANNPTELVQTIQRNIGLPVMSVSYWDENVREYVLLRSMGPLDEGKTKLWVATSGIKAMPITEEKDPLEFSTIREQIERLTPPEDGVVFAVKEILRIQNHLLEQKFKARKAQLFDPSARTVLKYHADTQPTDHVMKDGFRIPSMPGPYGTGIIFSSDISVAYQTESVRFLLCEIAVGRFTTLHNEEDRGASFEVLQHMGYDSVVARTSTHPTLNKLEEYIIYHPDQAIPRYLVTCGFQKSRGVPRSKRVDSCRHHQGEVLKLWCLTCGRLVCAFCMFGGHAGHTAKDVGEVASRERDLLMRCEAVLQRTIEQRQRDLADLEKMKAHYNLVAADTVKEMDRTIDDLKILLDQQHQEMLRQIDIKEGGVGARLAAFTSPMQEELAQLLGKQQQLREALEIARNPRPSSQAEFLNRTVDLHNSLNTVPKFDEAPDVTGHAPTVDLYIETRPVTDAIRNMCVEDRAPHPRRHVHPLGTLAMQPEGLLLRDDSLDSVESRLQVLEQGHIWVIPNVSEHFNHDQTRDIFSDPFLMQGQFWELKISFLPAERAVAVYLHAVRHQFRTNFRVAVFKANRWHVKSTRNWAEEFKGRGWGIKPFITLEDLDNYIVNDALKWVVVFTGNGLY